MKIKDIILLISFFLIGNQEMSSQSHTGSLPIIDFSKNYPQKEIRLQDIADIEYVPLETTDDILLSDEATLSSVSDKYILVYEPRLGDVYIYNRNGKLYSNFNHKGQSGREYTWIGGGGVFFDDKEEEIYVCSQYIQVYSLNGEHKRTVKKNTLNDGMKIFNFDDDALLVYDDVIIEPGFESKTKKNPYSLISKRDGGLISILDIHLPKRQSANKPIILENNKWSMIMMFFPYSMHYGKDFVIADISSDTTFMLSQNKELIPLFRREPSIHTSSEPRTILVPQLTTDKFMVLGLVYLDFNSKYGKIPMLMYEFDTREISKIKFLDDADIRGTWGPGTSPAIDKNKTAELIQVESIIDIYNKKRLKGDIEKLATSLNEDDNPVVRIITFK